MKKISFSLLFFLFVFASCKKKNYSNIKDKSLEISFIKQAELSFFNDKKELKKIDIELAQTEEETARGLMFRSSMKENQGMLFVFNDLEIRQFWMKDTAIDLDIIYIDENLKVINIAKNTPAFLEDSSKISPSLRPAKYVLEINAGLCDKWNIKQDTQIKWKLID